MKGSSYQALFLDVGGVILTNGWDHHSRKDAAERFDLDEAEMESRHALTFYLYEVGKMTLDEYLNRVVFYEPRRFSKEEFKQFMFDQSRPHPDMIDLIRKFKRRYSFKVVAVSNEGRELMDHRIQSCHLKEFMDLFVCSCFVHLRKPDDEIYQMACDLAQVKPAEVIYIDDRPLLAETGRKLGMQAIHHVTLERTENQLMDILSVNFTEG